MRTCICLILASLLLVGCQRTAQEDEVAQQKVEAQSGPADKAKASDTSETAAVEGEVEKFDADATGEESHTYPVADQVLPLSPEDADGYLEQESEGEPLLQTNEERLYSGDPPASSQRDPESRRMTINKPEYDAADDMAESKEGAAEAVDEETLEEGGESHPVPAEMPTSAAEDKGEAGFSSSAAATAAAEPAPARPADPAGPAGGGSGPGIGERNERRVEGAKKGDKPASAPVTSWKRSQVTANASRLMIGDREELPLSSLQVSAKVDGFRARVLMDCYFLNDRGQTLEGTFQLRLPDSASPYFMAFGETRFESQDGKPIKPAFFNLNEVQQSGTAPQEIMAMRSETWNQPKEARIVPKEKAAYAYRETVRRRVDPALMEWSGAGVFSARVFPLAPNRLHRITIGYDVDLQAVGGELEYQLDLPDVAANCVVDLDVAVAEGAQVKVTPQSEPVVLGSRRFFHFERPTERTLAVNIQQTGNVFLTGADEKTGPYFATSFQPKIPADVAAGGASRGVFLVDASLSANPQQFEIWLKLLRSVLDNNREALKEFAVVFFNVENFWWRDEFTANTPENVAALVKYADSLALEGATDLDRALAVARQPSWLTGEAKPCDYFLLSDGAATWGESDLHTMSARAAATPGALFAYTTGLPGTDTRALQHLTRETGGAVFSVVGEGELEAASTAHRSRPWELAKVELPAGEDLLLAGRPQTVFPGQRLLLAGRGAPPAGTGVVLTLRQGDTEQKVATKIDGTLASELAPRIYGQVATGQLEELQALTEEFSKAYATHFRVVGQTCSLLMLETEADYERFNIKPEEDAFVVKSNPAAKIVGETLAQMGKTLGDPKAGFLAWLKKMETMPGASFQTPTALRLAIESMPAETFAVSRPPLAAKGRTWQDVPGQYHELLAVAQLDYGDVTGEAARRLQQHGAHHALRAVSSLVERSPADSVLARDVGFSAMEWGLSGEAYHLFRRVAVSRPFEPQTYHAAARCLAEIGRTDLAIAYFEVALAGNWDARFGAFKQIVSLDYLRLLRKIERGELKTAVPHFAKARLQTVASQFPAKSDLVVVISWNTDGTDVDLHVLEPNGEECYYGHNQTKLGGRITQDVTQGYGPEMYTLPDAAHGVYRLRAKYYASDANRASTRTKVHATIYQDFGTEREKVTEKTVTLAIGQEMHDLGAVGIEK